MSSLFLRISKKLLPPATRFHLRTVRHCPAVQWAYVRRGEAGKAMRGFRLCGEVFANALCAVGLLKPRCECEFCGWTGYHFIALYYVDCYHAEAFCPACRLLDRYRTLVHFVRTSEWGREVKQRQLRVLDVAPTETSGDMLRQEFGAGEVVGFDIENPWATVLGDLQRMEFASESFDLILCYEVLDYIPRDDVGILEMFRVLKPGGSVLLQVGFDPDLEKTIEYAKPDPDDSGHIRRYGRDLFEKFRAAGFEDRLVENGDGVSETDRVRFGLDLRPFIILRRPAR